MSMFGQGSTKGNENSGMSVRMMCEIALLAAVIGVTGSFKLPNVIVTPHYAPTTVESATRVSKIAAENINAVLAGQEPVGCIV